MNPVAPFGLLLVWLQFMVGVALAAPDQGPPDALPHPQPGEEITVAFTSFQPYIYQLVDQTLGLQAQVLRHVLEQRQGYRVRFQELPWKRVQYSVEKGEVDAFIATRNDERDVYAVSSKVPVTTWWASAIVRKDWLAQNQVEIRRLEDLKPYKLGALQGNGWIEHNLKGYNIEWVQDMKQLIPMLLRGRVDVVPESPVVIPYYGAIHDLYQRITVLELEDASAGMFLYVSKRSKWLRILPEFDQQLSEARQTGELDKIIMSIFSRPL